MAEKCGNCGGFEVEEIEPGDWYLTSEPVDYDEYIVMECQDCGHVFLVEIDPTTK